MGEKIELNREEIIGIFPKLLNDLGFKITSKATPKYNCIAWAYNYDDRWMQYGGQYELDGVMYWWPDGVDNSPHIDAYIKAFQILGYEKCDDWKHEDGFVKVALYYDIETFDCTHAARERLNGTWTSKLGKSNDIAHGNPYTIEGDSYGKVACILKRKWE